MSCLWSGAFGLAMTGRAVAWGAVRRMFWWDLPTWADGRPGNADDADGPAATESGG